MKAPLAALVALALLPSSALAGGFATVDLSSLPDGSRPGEPWNVELTILQHGVTPMADLAPTISIRNGDQTASFEAQPAPGETGVYRAEVVFPTAGTWDYEIDDGFTQVHQYAPVLVDRAPTSVAAAPDGGGPWLPALFAALAAGAAVALLSARVLRRRRNDERAAAPAA